MSVIKTEKLNVKIGRSTILKNIDFEAKKGEITVLLGPNGSGKTTLLRTLGGSVKYRDGSVMINGCEIKKTGEKELSKLISVLPQSLPKISVDVETLISYGLMPSRSHLHSQFSPLSDDEKKKIDDIIVKYGMEKFRNRLVCHLSGGERQRAYLAMLDIQDCDVILLDEPTSALDVKYTAIMSEFLNEMKSEGRCVVVSMHDMGLAMQIADRIYVLSDGESVFEGTREDFIGSDVVNNVFSRHVVKAYDDMGREHILFE